MDKKSQLQTICKVHISLLPLRLFPIFLICTKSNWFYPWAYDAPHQQLVLNFAVCFPFLKYLSPRQNRHITLKIVTIQIMYININWTRSITRHLKSDSSKRKRWFTLMLLRRNENNENYLNSLRTIQQNGIFPQTATVRGNIACHKVLMMRGTQPSLTLHTPFAARRDETDPCQGFPERKLTCLKCVCRREVRDACNAPCHKGLWWCTFNSSVSFLLPPCKVLPCQRRN